MLTCFIKNNFRDPTKDIAVYSILAMPSIYLVYSIYSFVRIFGQRKVKADYEVKWAVIKYMLYSLFYIIFYFPSIVLYVLSINRDIERASFLSWFSYFCSLATISINLALCIFRILEGYVKCHWKALLVNSDLDQSLMTEDSEYFNEDNKSNPELKIPINESNPNLERNNSENKTPLFRSGSNRFRKNTSWKRLSVEITKGVKLY